MKPMNAAELQATRDQHETWLKGLPGVVGTGIGMDRSGRIALKVFSNQMPAATRDEIASRLGDVPVAFEETGEIRTQG